MTELEQWAVVSKQWAVLSGVEGAPSLSLCLLEGQGGDFDFYPSQSLPEPEIKIPTLSQKTREGWGTRSSFHPPQKNKGRDCSRPEKVFLCRSYFGGVVGAGLLVPGVVGLVVPVLGLAPVAPAGFDPGAGGATPDCAL
jgi:hypothetical protein